MDQMMFDRLTGQPANRNLLQETLSVATRAGCVPNAQESSIRAKNLDTDGLTLKDLT
jgi:hypothetical protein